MRIDVSQILVPVTVTDSWDRPVTSLPVESFRVFEDNVEQKIESLFREEGPVSVGFLFDASSSMRKRMDRSIKAMEQFLKTSMPGDEYFLVRFSDRPTLVTGFTHEPDQILKELSSIQPQGWTALLDAICLGVHNMKAAKNARRALIILSDGGDNSSRYTESEVRNLVRESDVRVYAIGIFERSRYLEKLAAESGGSAFFAHKLEDLPETVERLSTGFRNQYVLGYSSNNQQRDGKYRRVRVELNRALRLEPWNVGWRRGYYAPFE
jgi:VWFA-related protein